MRGFKSRMKSKMSIEIRRFEEIEVLDESKNKSLISSYSWINSKND